MLVGLDRAQSIQQLAYEQSQSGWHGHEQMNPSVDRVLASGSADSLNRLPGKVNSLAGRFQNGTLPAVGAIEVDIVSTAPVACFLSALDTPTFAALYAGFP